MLVEPEGDGNNQIVHYGGDSGRLDWYRKGKLYFYNNTVISKRTDATTLVSLSTDDEQADCRNNIIYVTAPGASLAMLNTAGVLDLNNNWLKPGWVKSREENFKGTVNDTGRAVGGDTLWFCGWGPRGLSFGGRLILHRGRRGAGGGGPSEYGIDYEYVAHRASVRKLADAGSTRESV